MGNWKVTMRHVDGNFKLFQIVVIWIFDNENDRLRSSHNTQLPINKLSFQKLSQVHPLKPPKKLHNNQTAHTKNSFATKSSTNFIEKSLKQKNKKTTTRINEHNSVTFISEKKFKTFIGSLIFTFYYKSTKKKQKKITGILSNFLEIS